MSNSHFILRESLLSAAINAAISIGFYLAVFGRTDPIPVWGIGNLAFDYLPQSFAVALMSALIPGLLTRLAQKRGKVGNPSGAIPSPGQVIAISLAWATGALVIAGGSSAAILWLTTAETMPALQVFIAKALYGALLGMFVTSRVLKRQLS